MGFRLSVTKAPEETAPPIVRRWPSSRSEYCVPIVSQGAAKGGGDTLRWRRKAVQNPLIEAKFAALAPQVDSLVQKPARDLRDWLAR